MSQGHDRFEDLLPAYALGALEGDDLTELETHLRTGCPRCTDRLRDWEGELESLAGSVPPIQPSAVTRTRLVQQVRRESAARQSARSETEDVQPDRHSLGRGFRWSLAASWVAVVLSLGALVGVVGSQTRVSRELGRAEAARDHLEQELRRVQGELGHARSELAGLRTHVERLVMSVQTLGDPRGRSFLLTGLEGAPDAGGVTLVDPRVRRAVFHVYGLPEPPAGKTYQLWWIAAGKPVSAGIFAVDETGSASLEIEPVPAQGIDLWAVTVEPEGGVSQPTGPMVLRS